MMQKKKERSLSYAVLESYLVRERRGGGVDGQIHEMFEHVLPCYTGRINLRNTHIVLLNR